MDTSRPLTWNDNIQNKPGKIFGNTTDNFAWAHLHYVNLGCEEKFDFAGGVCEEQEEGLLIAFGEVSWCCMMPGDPSKGLESFAASASRSRVYGAAYTSAWDILNYWPNFLKGGGYENAGFREGGGCLHDDRVDGVDGWGSEVVDWVTRAFSPFWIFDEGAYDLGPIFVEGWGEGGSSLERKLVFFNDGLENGNFAVEWEVEWEDGEKTGGLVEIGMIEAGSKRGVELLLSDKESEKNKSWRLVLRSIMENNVVYVEDRIFHSG